MAHQWVRVDNRNSLPGSFRLKEDSVYELEKMPFMLTGLFSLPKPTGLFLRYVPSEPVTIPAPLNDGRLYLYFKKEDAIWTLDGNSNVPDADSTKLPAYHQRHRDQLKRIGLTPKEVLSANGRCLPEQDKYDIYESLETTLSRLCGPGAL